MSEVAKWYFDTSIKYIYINSCYVLVTVILPP